MSMFFFLIFFFNDTATTEIYTYLHTLSLHDALPIWRLDMPMERVIVTVDKHGNTSSGSVPLALDEAIRSGKVERGQLLLLEAFGGGFTWGSALLRYCGTPFNTPGYRHRRRFSRIIAAPFFTGRVLRSEEARGGKRG